jgi:hypothetical protein
MNEKDTAKKEGPIAGQPGLWWTYAMVAMLFNAPPTERLYSRYPGSRTRRCCVSGMTSYPPGH